MNFCILDAYSEGMKDLLGGKKVFTHTCEVAMLIFQVIGLFWSSLSPNSGRRFISSQIRAHCYVSTLNVSHVIILYYFLEALILKYKFCFTKVLHSEQTEKSATVNLTC